MSMETLLRAEIEDQLAELNEMETGSEQYKTTVDGITKLMDRAIEINKFDNELQDKIDAREAENFIKNKQIEEEKKDRVVKNVLTGAGIIIPSGVAVWGTLKSLRVEFKGNEIVTSTAGKEMIKKVMSFLKR